MSEPLKNSQVPEVRSDLYRRLIETSLDGIIIASVSGEIFDVNQAACGIFGYVEEAFLALKMEALFDESDVRLLPALRQRDAIGFFSGELSFLRFDGVRFEGEISTAFIPYESERGIFSLIIRDTTERKRVEALLNRSLLELEAFSYSVSHDLRAPLRGIDGWSLALKEDYADALDENGKLYVDRIRADVKKIAGLIDAVLGLSRVSRVENPHSRIDLSALATRICTEMHEAASDRKIEFKIMPALIAEGDSELLEILLTNLLSNAIKYTGKTAIARIEFGTLGSAEETVYFVQDNGVGFDARFAGKLFVAFQRYHASSDFPGTGIGLATVHRIIRRYGGRIWAESSVGEGATFYFTLGRALVA